MNKSQNCSYHSDSDFSEHDETSNRLRLPTLPKLAAPGSFSLMSFLCSDE